MRAAVLRDFAIAVGWGMVAACSGTPEEPPPIADSPAGSQGSDAGVGLTSCSSNPCDPNATCAEGATGAECTCNEGFTGDGAHCLKVFLCDPNPCANGGRCIDGIGKASCSCIDGYHGDQCELEPPNCAAIKTATPTAADGVYSVLPDPKGKVVSVYCDMTTDGGGWTKILQTGPAPYTPTVSAFGTIATSSTTAFAKLADSVIQGLAVSLGADVVYRFRGTASPTGQKLFIWSKGAFADTSVGYNLVATAPYSVCEDAVFSQCKPVVVNKAASTIDSITWGVSPNDADRYFTDLYGLTFTVACYNPATMGQRCFSTGLSTDHALNPRVTIWLH